MATNTSRSFRMGKMPSASMLTSGRRKIAIAVDLSPESAYAVKWAVENYLRRDDHVILLHVQPTSVLYGADWGAVEASVETGDKESQQKLEDDFDALTSSKASDLAQPLIDARIAYAIHIVKDHDMKERICLEAERLRASALIMGSRGFGASKRLTKSLLGSVSDYCVHHCDCPVVVVRYPEECKDGNNNVAATSELEKAGEEDEDGHAKTLEEGGVEDPPIHQVKESSPSSPMNR